MATRFRFPACGAPAVAPALDGWNVTTDPSGVGGKRFRTGLNHRESTQFNRTLSTVSIVNQNYLMYQYVSDPIDGAGTLSGTIQGVWIAQETATTNDMMSQMTLRVFSRDGTTERGTPYDFDDSALSNELNPASPRNIGVPRGSVAAAKTLTNVSYSDGDRLVFEVGVRQIPADGDAFSVANFNNGTDLTLDETGTTVNTAWIELSQTLTFKTDEPVPVGAGAIAATATDGGTIAPALPANWAADDIAFCLVMTNADNVPTISAGWTEETAFAQNHANQSTKLWWRRLVGGDTAPTVTDGGTTALSTTNGMFGRVYCYRNCVTSGTPYEVPTAVGNTTAETTPDTAAITTTAANRRVVNFCAIDDDTAFSSGSPPAGWAYDQGDATSITGADVRFNVLAQMKVSAGSVAAAVVGTLAAVESWRSLTLALISPSAAAVDDPFPYVGAGYYPAAA